MEKRAYRLEDYLKRILCLSRTKPVHAVDLARDLEVSRPTVSVFLKQLQQDGYVTVGAHHIITLTPKGLAIAKETHQRHQTIQHLLESFGVPREVAASDACAIEHDLSRQSYEAIKRFTKNQYRRHQNAVNRSVDANVNQVFAVQFVLVLHNAYLFFLEFIVINRFLCNIH